MNSDQKHIIRLAAQMLREEATRIRLTMGSENFGPTTLQAMRERAAELDARAKQLKEEFLK